MLVRQSTLTFYRNSNFSMKLFSSLGNLIVYLTYCLTFLNFSIVKFKFSHRTCAWLLALLLLLALIFHFCYGYMQFKKGTFKLEKVECRRHEKIWIINFWMWQVIAITGSLVYFLLAIYCLPSSSLQSQICFYVLLPLVFIGVSVSSVLESLVRIRMELIMQKQQSSKISPRKSNADNV